MTTKPKNDLRAALAALDVRKPLRLPAVAPAFTPPNPVLAAPDAAALVSAETPVATETQVEQETRVATPTPVIRETMVLGRIQVPAQTRVCARALVGGGAKVQPGPEPHHAPEQDSAVALEAQASPKLQLGYTRIPNALLMRMVAGDLLRSEMQVALLIARLTISYQRRFSPISKAVVERQTGLRGPAVLHALAELVAKGIIEKIRGDQNRPNQFGLVGVDEWIPSASNPPGAPSIRGTSVPTTTQASTRTPVAAPTSAPVSGGTPALAPAATHFKDRETYSNTPSRLPEIRSYFDGLKPARKRESEWRAFQELQADYAAEDIADALAFIVARGVGNGETAQPCHSPMAFLSKAMGGILPEVQEQRQKARERTEREQREAEAARRRAEDEAREASEWATKERAFVKAFPGEERQREALDELLQGLPFRSMSQAGRVMGVSKWWESLNRTERLELTENQ